MTALAFIFAAFACAVGLAVCVLVASYAAARRFYGSAVVMAMMAVGCAFLIDAAAGAVEQAYAQAVQP